MEALKGVVEGQDVPCPPGKGWRMARLNEVTLERIPPDFGGDFKVGVDHSFQA